MKRAIMLLFLIPIISSGCTTFQSNRAMVSQDSVALGYRLGVQENINKFAENFIGNDFPYYYWQAPLVQKVYIPAHTRGGVMIPAHYEYVIIDPAEWRETFGYPISTQYEEVTDETEYNYQIGSFDSHLLDR